MWSLKNLESLGKKHTQKLRYLYPVLETNFQDLEIGHYSFSKLSQFKEKKEEMAFLAVTLESSPVL